MKEEYPYITVVAPCRNEVKHIEKTVKDVLHQDYPTDKIEFLIVDGGSDDGTKELLEKIQERNPEVKVLDNPRYIPPAAMNIALEEARGEYIVRIDVHASYPVNYLKFLINKSKELNASNVGGIWNTLPGKGGQIPKAIALAISSPIGVGNAMFRIGTKDPMKVDTVPYGCYKKKLLETIGGYDEEMIKNEDEELNGRILKEGGTIWLIPQVVIDYYARSSYSLLWKQYYLYGYYKPLVNKKLGNPVNLRQFAPPFFVLGLLITLILTFLSSWPWFFPLYVVAYFLTLFGVSIPIAIKEGAIYCFLLPIAFMVVHSSYGIGYVMGWINLNSTNTKKNVGLHQVQR